MRISFNNIILKPVLTKNNVLSSRPEVLKEDTFVKSNAQSLSFKGKRCSTASFKIKDVKNLHCPICGLLMLDDEEKIAFINDTAYKKGEKLKKALEKYEDETIFFEDTSRSLHRTIYRPQKQKVINIVKEMAPLHPDLDLSGLFKLKASEVIDELIKNQLKVVDELEQYLSEASVDEEEKTALFEIIDKYKKQILGESETRFARAKFIYAISNQISDENIKNDVDKIMSALPQSKNDTNSFFVNYNDISSREIASKFVYETTATAEHLRPKSKGGGDMTSNYICDCADCNSTRGNIAFEQWIKNIDNLEENLQYYLLQVYRAINEGELPEDYKDYVDEIVEKIYKLSNGQIHIKSPYLTEDENKKAIFTKRKEKISKIKEYVEGLKEKRNGFVETKEALVSHPYYIAKQSQNPDLEEWENIDTKFEDMKDIMSDVEEYCARIEELRAFVSDGEELEKTKTELLEENKQLRLENSIISKNKNFNPDNNAKVNEQKRIKHLLYEAELMNEMLQYSKDRQEIVEIATGVLNNKLVKLMQDCNVKYRINEERIKANIEKLKDIRKKCHDISTNLDLIAFWEAKILKTTGGLTKEEYIRQYRELACEKETVEKINNIHSLEEQIDVLDDQIEYNSEILTCLEGYVSMTNQKFASLINRIY